MPNNRKPQQRTPSRSMGRSSALRKKGSTFKTPAQRGKTANSKFQIAQALEAESLNKTVATLPVGENGLPLTRRHFLFGALGLGAAAVVAAGAKALGSNKEEKGGSDGISVPEKKVFALDDCAEVERDTCFSLIGSYELPFGTLAWSNNDEVAALIIPTEEASPLVQVAVLWLSSGNYYTVLESANGADEGFEIFDARASENGLVWVEANILQKKWRVLSASLDSELNLGQAQMLDEGEKTTEMPSIAAIGSNAYWQVIPVSNSENLREESSYLKKAAFKSGKAKTLYTAQGRMGCPLCASSAGVVIAARNAESYSNYDLLYFPDDGEEATDSLTLPSGMTPDALGFGPNGLSFCFQNIYDFGDGISNLGTYTPAKAHKPGAAYDGLTWFRFDRTPTTGPCWCTDKWLMVKSTSAICAVNLDQKLYCSLDVESGCEDWGDYLISSGSGSLVAGIMQIDQITSTGDSEHYCLMRVWEATGESGEPGTSEEEEEASEASA